ncbi:hypothetical protein MCOR14_008640 [Pyricularia oryzae]|nr:hypothetical protein MCOR13_006200 [Pyricularia oryzae]KAI6627740.1 hypothetical protein MCOR14_008640 [Pyricularia oryzae]
MQNIQAVCWRAETKHPKEEFACGRPAAQVAAVESRKSGTRQAKEERRWARQRSNKREEDKICSRARDKVGGFRQFLVDGRPRGEEGFLGRMQNIGDMQAEVLEPPEILTYQTRKQPSSCLQPRCAACSNSNIFRAQLAFNQGDIRPSVRPSGLFPCALERREREENHPPNGTCNYPSGYYSNRDSR